MLSAFIFVASLKVCGFVEDHNGAPLNNATVREQATVNTVSTDAKGQFCINLTNTESVLTVWKNGYLISAKKVRVKHDLIEEQVEKVVFTLSRLPENDERYEWLASLHSEMGENTPTQFQPCENCHQRITREWGQSSHANIDNQSLFNKLINSENIALPTAQCMLCHTPVSSNSVASISCDFCHKIIDVDSSDSLLLGKQRISFLKPQDSQVFFGSLDDVARERDSFNPLYKKSEYCAACHQGRFWKTNIYSDYSEWIESQYAEQGTECQSCHMVTSENYAADPHKGGVFRASDTLSNHHFKTELSDVVKAIESKVEFDNQSDGLSIRIELVNRGAGHRVPGGNPMRHLILIIDVVDSNGKPVQQIKGSRIPNWVRGNLPGKAGNAYGKVLVAKTGYDRVSKVNRLYPSPFWVNSYIESDNRLAPMIPAVESILFEPVQNGRISVTLLLREFYDDWLGLGEPKTTTVFFREFSL